MDILNCMFVSFTDNVPIMSALTVKDQMTKSVFIQRTTMQEK